MGELNYTTGGESNLVSFKSAARVPITSLKAHFLPKQDLHGYSKPWVGGSGENIWDEEWELGTFNTTTGENIELSTQIRAKNLIPISANTTYYFKSVEFVWILFYDENQNVIENYYLSNTISTSGNASTIKNTTFLTPSNGAYMRFYLLAGYGTTYNNDISINKTSTNTSYSPYENICPIEGWNNLEVGLSHKNLLDTTKNNRATHPTFSTENGIVNCSSVTAWNSTHIWFTQVFPAGTYTISCDYSGTGSNGPRLICSASINGGTWNNSYQGYWKNFTDRSCTFTTNKSFSVALVFISRTDHNGESCTFYNIQLEQGSVATEYEPYYGKQIPITFPILGKNKFNPNCEMLQHGTYVINNDQITQSGSDGRGWTQTEFKPISLPAGTYTISCSDGGNFNVRTSVDNYNSNKQITGGSGTFTLIQDCDVKIKHSISTYPTTYTVQLELGDTATTYEPYNPDNTVYGGYVDVAKGEAVQEYALVKIEHSTPNRTLGITAQDNTKISYWLDNHFHLPKAQSYVAYNKDGWCSHLPYEVNNYRRDMHADASNYTVDIQLPGKHTAETAEQWFEENGPVYVVYHMANPITYPLTQTSLRTLLGTNNIWTNTNSNTEVSYAIHDTAPIRAAKHRIAAAEPHIITGGSTFTTDLRAPLKSAKIYFNPVQEGTGDPSPTNIRPITGWTGLFLYHSGDNLYVSNENNKGYINSSGVINVDNYSTYTDLIPVTVGSTYSFKCTTESVNGNTHRRIHGYNSEGTWVQQLGGGLTEPNTVKNFVATVTIPTGISFIRVSFRNQDTNVRLAKEDVYEVDWSNDIGTVYGGYVDLVTGEVWETHHKITLDGVTTNCKVNIDYSDSTYIVAGVVYLIPAGKSDEQYQTTLLCNNMPILAPSEARPSSYPYIRTISAGQQYLRIYVGATADYPDLDTKAKRIAFVNEYLAEHPTTVVYPLATPTLFATLAPTILKTLKGINNIWTTANGPVDIQYYTH